MRKLPGACHAKDDELNDNPANDTGVGSLRLVTEFGLPLTLEDLFPPNIVESCVEVLDAASNVFDLVLVGALELAGLADGEVQVETDAAVGVVDAEPAVAARGGAGGKAKLMVAGIGGGKGEAAGAGTTLGDNAVVVVKDFINGDIDGDALVGNPSPLLLVPFLSRVVANHEGVLGKLLEEASRGNAVNVEVERLSKAAQGQEGEKGPHFVSSSLARGKRSRGVVVCREYGGPGQAELANCKVSLPRTQDVAKIFVPEHNGKMRRGGPKYQGRVEGNG